MFAAHHKLNLTAIVDDNKQSCANFTKDILRMGNLGGKFHAFRWEFSETRGHDINLLRAHFAPIPGPIAVRAKTTKGKGIPFMEGNPAWHHQIPVGEQIEIAGERLWHEISRNKS